MPMGDTFRISLPPPSVAGGSHLPQKWNFVLAKA
jgi:hypothetical protein